MKISKVQRVIRIYQKTKLTVTVLFAVALAGGIVSGHSTSAGGFSQTTSAASQKDVALGLNHFEAHCASCHGQSGKADHEKGKTVGAADLTSKEMQSKSDAELMKMIQRGIPGTAMPAFGKTHKPTEVKQIIAFLRKLPTLTPDERKKLEEAVPDNARHKHGTAPHQEDGHHHEQATNTGAAQKPTKQQMPDVKAEKAVYMCSMHPEVKSAQPGKCPKCGMSLEKTKAGTEEHKHSQMQQDGKPAKEQQPAQQHDHSKMQNQKGESAGHMKGNEDAGHDMNKMSGNHDMNSMMSTITGGPFQSMLAIGSGTSLLPASSPGNMWHWMKGDWMVMAHGDIKAGFNHQGGPRGINKAESQNWLMLMAERNAGGGRLMLRGMLSAEPWTTPRRGFPELFQTGETYKGRPIIDAQHPHDLFMELAAAYTLPVSEGVSINLYGGPVGEPALGPVAFMHRASASENPAAPLGHHWHDSTHIAHGVFTAGVTAGRFKLESSIFRGAEPDENRKTIDFGKLDSYSGRLWFTPTPDWTMQVSYGYLTNPEALEPGDLKRWTASIHHNRAWQDGNLASSLIWGRNSEEHGKSNAYLFESTLNFKDKNYLFTRLELGDKIGLLQENVFGRRGLIDDHHHDDDIDGNDSGDEHSTLAEQWNRIGAFTFGGVRDLVAKPKLRVGIGAGVTFYHVPDGLQPIYGSSPTSFQIFLRLRPGKM
jgi:mono/diheme cytochrome c family protein